MTLKEFAPYNNRIVRFKLRSGDHQVGVFIDCIPKEEKLFPEEVMFIAEGDIQDFKKAVEGAVYGSRPFQVALETFAIRADLNNFKSFEFTDGNTKYGLMSKWKGILNSDRKFQAYLKLEEYTLIDDQRTIPLLYGGLRIEKKGDQAHISELNDKGPVLKKAPITLQEFEELFELYEKKRLF